MTTQHGLKPKRDFKIAIIGSRGVPAKYGGFETAVETVAPRLAEMGWSVSVSCEGPRDRSKPAVYKGVNLFYFPVRPFFRIIYEVLYDVYSLVKSSLACRCIYMLGYGAGLLFFIPKVLRRKLAVNVDGLEWKRDKFNGLEKSILLASERAAVTFADVIVADSREVARYIEGRYKKKAVYITNGVDAPQVEKWDERKFAGQDLLKDTALLPDGYWLAVARLEPENNIHVILQAFLKSNSSRKLLIVGNFSSKKYESNVLKLLGDKNARERVVLTGAIYDVSLLNMLRQNCFAYIHGHSVGGTNPALLEAMSMKNLIIAHDNEFNREVGGQTILYFKDASDLLAQIEEIETRPDSFAQLKEAASSRVLSHYSWGDIVREYDKLFQGLCPGRTGYER
jgi:glycosyltransferase involved in cell wall biosynthesis